MSDGEFPYTGPFTYALGWTKAVYKGEEIFDHRGGIEAFHSIVFFCPRLKYGVVMLANTGGMAHMAVTKLFFHLLDEKLGVQENERFDWEKE